MTSATDTNDAVRMDRHYRFQRHIYDSTRTHYLLGRMHLLGDLDPPTGGTVLEIGCGTAWNLVRAARLYPDARLFGLDVSEAMLATARGSLGRAGLSGRVRLAQGDATVFTPMASFREPAFDRVYISYALSMIPAWTSALAAAAAAVAPGGSLHVVDFGQCEPLPASFKHLLFAFLDHYTVTPRADLEEALGAEAERRGCTVTFARMNRGYTYYGVMRRPA